MENTIVRHSKIKRIIITLLPVMCLLGVFLCAKVSVKCLEYGSVADRIVSNIGLSLFIPMFVSIIFMIKIYREKMVFDGYDLIVTPFIGMKKIISLQEVKVCTINCSHKIKLFDKNSNLICKYSGTEDKQNVILKALQKIEKIVFTFRINDGRQIIAKGSDKIVSEYLATGKIIISQNCNTEMYGFQEAPYAEGEINKSIWDCLRKNRRKAFVRQIICMIVFMLGIFLLIFQGKIEIIRCIAMLLFWGGIVITLILDYYWKRREFALIKPTFYRVTAIVVDEKDFSPKSSGIERHLIYEFQDKYGAVRRRPSDKINTKDMAWGVEFGARKTLWYSPYSEYLLETEPIKMKLLNHTKKLSPKVWVKRHPVLVISCIAILIWVSFYLYQYGKGQVFIYQNGGKELQTKWVDQNDNMEEQVAEVLEATGMEQEELEAWLKQSFYPYFYANDASNDEFEAFNVENYGDSINIEGVQKIKVNLSKSWGIDDRKSLIRVTNSVLKKGDKYTYSRTLDKMGEECMELSKDAIIYNYKIYDPKEYYRYLGTYFAYNEIGDAGVDAWDYCRCIRLFAFGYICGYISYDEYLIHAAPLAVRLQEEYDSWTQMYQSYYYGHLIFLGRNEYTNVSALYDNYSDYNEMGENVKIPFKEE